MKWIKRSLILVAITLFVMLGGQYYSCYYVEHTISTKGVLAFNGEDHYELSVKCRAITGSTFAPFASIKLNSTEILRADIDPGFDTLNDCMISTVETIELNMDCEQGLVFMKNGEVKVLDFSSWRRRGAGTTSYLLPCAEEF